MRDSNYQIVINNNWFVEIDEWIFQFFPEDIRKSLDPKKIDSFKNYRQDNLLLWVSEIRNIRSRGSNFLF